MQSMKKKIQLIVAQLVSGKEAQLYIRTYRSALPRGDKIFKKIVL